MAAFTFLLSQMPLPAMEGAEKLLVYLLAKEPTGRALFITFSVPHSNGGTITKQSQPRTLKTLQKDPCFGTYSWTVQDRGPYRSGFRGCHYSDMV